jgi:hypothetical protein
LRRNYQTPYQGRPNTGSRTSEWPIQGEGKKLAQIAEKKAKLADEWVLSNMNPETYKELKSTLNKEEMRLKSLRANIDPSRIAELESTNEILEYWQNQFQPAAEATKDNGGGLILLERTKPTIRIYGLEDIGPMESTASPIEATSH